MKEDTSVIDPQSSCRSAVIDLPLLCHNSPLLTASNSAFVAANSFIILSFLISSSCLLNLSVDWLSASRNFNSAPSRAAFAAISAFLWSEELSIDDRFERPELRDFFSVE